MPNDDMVSVLARQSDRIADLERQNAALVANINTLDALVHWLGIEDSHETPIEAVGRKIAEARRQALEEAALACEDLSFLTDVSELLTMTKQEMSVRTCHEAAKAIRALMDKAQG